MTPETVEKLLSLREDDGLSYCAIAKRLRVSESIVSYYCLKEGAEHPTRRGVCYVKPGAIERRGDHLVRRFTPEEDALILRLDAEGLSSHNIGLRCEPPRRGNSVKGRLMTLARREARAEEALAA